MRRPHPLPASLPTAFSVTTAREAGVSPARLRAGDLETPFHGVRSSEPVGVELGGRCRALAPRLREGQFFSHETALAAWGVPLPPWPYRPAVHVSAHRPAREPRTAGVVGHRLQTRPPAFVLRDGLPVEQPARAWRQAATLWSLDDIVTATDALRAGPRPLVMIEDLRTELAEMGDVGGGMLRRALALTRAGVRSPRETRLRLLLLRAGLPEPEINWNLHDDSGVFVAELDLAYPRWRVAPEYDGRVHAFDARQFASDADRWHRIRMAGWDHIRCLSHHMAGDGSAAVRMVRDALTRAGWRPGW